MRRIMAIALFVLGGACSMNAQQPQSSVAPDFAASARYTQGVGIGYRPQDAVAIGAAGLVLNIGGGTAWCNGTVVTYAASNLTMANNATNRVYLNTSSSCVPAVKSTAFVAADIPIATVTTVTGAITAIADQRTLFISSAASVTCGSMPALVGDTTSSAGSCTTATSKINGTSFAGTSGHVAGFGAANIPADTGIVAADVVTQTSNGTSGYICTYTGTNKVCVPAQAVPNGVTATTQSVNDNSTKVATDAYVDRPVFAAAGTTVSAASNSEIVVCTGTCTVTPLTPALGIQLCVLNDDNVTSVITLAALGGSARYESQARTSYGTAGSGTLVMGGAAKDQVCIFGLDSTHYLTVSVTGTATVN